MGDLTIRGLDEALLSQLAKSAREHGRTPEEEARHVLESTLEALAPPAEEERLASLARRIFAPLGGVELQPLSRTTWEPPDFSQWEPTASR